jgi:hypothetical protein
MRYPILFLCILLISCSEKTKKKPLDFNEKVVEFAIENSNDQFIEVEVLYNTPSNKVLEDDHEEVILVQILKKKGFEITNWGRGNHPLGPRVVVLNLKKNSCECEVQKTYYSTDDLPNEIYKTTEKIKCK